MRRDLRLSALFLAGALLWQPLSAQAAKPSAAQALQLKPIQSDVDFDVPSGPELEKCTIAAEKINGNTGWIVKDGENRILRRFLDSNGDKVVDQWCYYKLGIEVYRDIDGDFNGKADQYRWFNTAGIRWGLDENEDGKIENWKQISPEEVTAEVVAALAKRDAGRFRSVLLSEKELKALGLGDKQESTLAKSVEESASGFAKLAANQREITGNSQWAQFAASRPGIVPRGTEDSTKDLMVYENVMAIVETGGKHAQVYIGTLVKVGDTWRAVDLPTVEQDAVQQASTGGRFFAASLSAPSDVTERAAGAPSEEMQKLLEDLEKLDKLAAAATTDAEQGRLNQRRTDLLEQLAEASSRPADRAQWLRQMADLTSVAIQTGGYQEGLTRLKSLADKLEKGSDKDLAAYVKFRYLTADNVASMQGSDVDFAKVQERWLANLEEFVKDYPSSSDAAEAMLQLGIAQEFSGEEKKAQDWYEKIVTGFPQAPAAEKARGAVRRLTSVGKSIPLSATSLDGSQVDLARYKGKVVLIHYWATWCEPCKSDMSQIKELVAKYGSKGFAAIGVNLDASAGDAEALVKRNRLPWPHLHEEGGLDSRLANEMGILTLPTMILIDKSGNVLNRGIHISELESELEKQLK